jgi:O-antigen ligase
MNTLVGRQTSPAPAIPPAVVVIVVAVGVALSVVWHQPAVAATAALCGAAVALSSIRIALIALAFLAPFDGYISSVVVYRDFLAADVVGLAIIVGQWRRGAHLPRGAAVTAALWVLALLCALHVLSLGPLNWREAADNVARFIYFALLVAAVASAARDVPLRAVTAALVAGVALRFIFEGRYYFSSSTFVLHYSYQFGVMTSNPNTLAGVAACVLPMSCSFILAPGPRAGRRLAAVVTLLLLAGILLSYSKGAWLTASAALTLWTWHVVRRGWVRWRALGVAVALAVVIAALIPQTRRIPALIVERWVSQGSVISNRERVRYLETAAVLVRQHPIFGVGLERFGSAYLAARHALRGPDDPHNAYLMVAVELGVPALGCYIFLMAIVFVTTYRYAESADDDHAPLRIALSASVAGLLVFQLFSAEPLTSRIIWVIMALAIAPPPEALREATRPALRRRGDGVFD